MHLLLATGMATVPEGKGCGLAAHQPLYSAWLALVICGFYTWFWTRAGQTIGMRAWRLRIQNVDGSNIRITQALIRLATSTFGLGNPALRVQPRAAARLPGYLGRVRGRGAEQKESGTAEQVNDAPDAIKMAPMGALFASCRPHTTTSVTTFGSRCRRRCRQTAAHRER